jgi:hypothetical protein
VRATANCADPLSFAHERSRVHLAEPWNDVTRASALRRLRDRADRAIRLVRRLPEGLLPSLRPPPFLHIRMPGERLPPRTLRPFGGRRGAVGDMGATGLTKGGAALRGERGSLRSRKEKANDEGRGVRSSPPSPLSGRAAAAPLSRRRSPLSGVTHAAYVQCVAQTVTEQIERHDRDDDCQSRKDTDPPGLTDEVTPLVDCQPPGRRSGIDP